MPADHSNPTNLRTALRRALEFASSWSGIAFRTTAVRYASREDLITGAGAREFGGRWNPRGVFHTVYLSLDVDTALAEFFGSYAHYGVEAAERTPYVTAAVDARLQVVLDLTDAAVTRLLKVPRADLVAPGWQAAQEKDREALTQLIGRLAYELGAEALLVPSAARGPGRNLVVFPWKLQPPDSYLSIRNADALPRVT